MAVVVANGAAVLDTGLYMPRIGAWHADLLVDLPDLQGGLTSLAGPVDIVINDGAMILRGTAIRSGDYLDVARVRVVAGAAGLGKSAKPKRYVKATVGLVLADLLRDAGETLDPTASAVVLGRQVGDWTTQAVPVGAAIAALFARFAADASWRMIPDGTMWVGVETWPDSGLDPETFQLVENAIEEAMVRYTLDAPVDIVGKTFDGTRVSYVQMRVAPQGPVVADIWQEVALSVTDRMKAALAAIIRATPPGLDVRFRYWAKVIQQSGNTIHVLPEDPGIPDMGTVQLALGPGETVDGMLGGRVLVGWDGARGAYAEGFDGGTPTERVLNATLLYTGGKPGAQPPVMGTAFASATSAFMTALATYTAGIAAVADPSALFTPALTTAIGLYVSAVAAAQAANTRVR